MIASPEIKTKVANSTLGSTARLSTPDLISCEVGDDKFKKYFPRDYVGQIMLQAIGLKVDFFMYFTAGETVLLYSVFIRVPSTCRNQLESRVE